MLFAAFRTRPAHIVQLRMIVVKDRYRQAPPVFHYAKNGHGDDSRDPAQAFGIGGELPARHRGRLARHVELENPGDHHDGLRPMCALGSHVAKRRIAVDEETAANPLEILNHPVSAVVLADHEQRRAPVGGG